MNEKLIHDYWLETGNSIYIKFEIEIQDITNGEITFKEKNINCPNYHQAEFEIEKIHTFEILAWVYSKI